MHTAHTNSLQQQRGRGNKHSEYFKSNDWTLVQELALSQKGGEPTIPSVIPSVVSAVQCPAGANVTFVQTRTQHEVCTRAWLSTFLKSLERAIFEPAMNVSRLSTSSN